MHTRIRCETISSNAKEINAVLVILPTVKLLYYSSVVVLMPLHLGVILDLAVEVEQIYECRGSDSSSRLALSHGMGTRNDGHSGWITLEEGLDAVEQAYLKQELAGLALDEWDATFDYIGVSEPKNAESLWAHLRSRDMRDKKIRENKKLYANPPRVFQSILNTALSTVAGAAVGSATASQEAHSSGLLGAGIGALVVGLPVGTREVYRHLKAERVAVEFDANSAEMQRKANDRTYNDYVVNSAVGTANEFADDKEQHAGPLYSREQYVEERVRRARLIADISMAWELLEPHNT
ncbi:MAG: hypothetical protein ABIA93_06005 [Candidatus Woesearchaeota archaeon]